MIKCEFCVQSYYDKDGKCEHQAVVVLLGVKRLLRLCQK